MCGIAGQLNFDGRPVSRERLESMAARLAHRGPDGSGVRTFGAAGLAHRRLKIIDLSDAARQPMANEDGSIWLIYNGEIYNYKELREQLEGAGHRFASSTDSEVILHGYEEWGLDCLRRFNGMFAFAVWDNAKQRLWLVRDRLGVKPLFYAVSPSGLTFGSEVKAVLDDPAVNRALDYESLSYYLALNYLPAPFTLFKQIRQLEPGQQLIADAHGNVTLSRYWDIAFDNDPPPRSEASWRDELDATMLDAVRLRLRSDVPFGVFLSGGVDSSGVAYWMSRHLDTPVQAFTASFREDSYNELRYARLAAGAVGAELHERVIDADAAMLLPTIVAHAEEPTADSSMVAVYHLARFARERVTVVLSGDGADDMLAGYETHQAYYLHRAYRAIPRMLRQGIIRPIVESLPASYEKVSLETKLKRFVAAGDLDWQAAHASWRMIFSPADRRRLLAPVATQPGASADAVDLYKSWFKRSNARDPLNQMLYVDTMLYLPADMLVKIDRMTMAHGLEAREPYLDYRVVELCARMPAALKLHRLRHKKHILKQVLRGRVPDEVLFRKKQGFNVPKAQWIQSGLRDFVNDTLAPSRIKATNILDPAVVADVVRSHFSGRQDRSHEIWSLLVLSIWFDQFGSAREAIA
jgi:asparagine synthase (glutamine-hydrolysing)